MLLRNCKEDMDISKVVFILAAILNLASGRALKSESTPWSSIAKDLEKFTLVERNEEGVQQNEGSSLFELTTKVPSSSDDSPSYDASGVSTNEPAEFVALPEPTIRRLRRDNSCYLGWGMVVLPDGVKQPYAICKNGCTGSGAFMVGRIAYPTVCS